MNSLEQLISELCPEGVPFEPLSRLLDYEQPGKYLVATKDYSDEYLTPVLTAGKTFVLGYTSEEHGIYEASTANPVIIFDDFTTASKWVDFPFKAKSSAMKLLTPKRGTENLLRYAFYVMQTIRYAPEDHARQWIGTYSNIRVPVPPVEVQREIVRILDQFTELNAQLEAELEARRHQYDFYRDHLLAFPIDVPQVALGDLGSIFGGLAGKSKADFSNGNARFASYRNVFSNISLDTKAVNFVHVATGERQRSLEYGDIIFTASSESLAEVGMTSAVTERLTEPLYLNSFCIGFRPNDVEQLNPDFAKHLFRSSSMRDQIRKTASGVTRINISKARLSKILVPLPNRVEQLRIAGVLDCLYALVNDLSVGLPAELSARRKQYDYYRDRLLTFEEASA